MKKDIYFGDFVGPYWPHPGELRKYFDDPLGLGWPSNDGNDEWGMGVQGLYGTHVLPDLDDQVTVELGIVGHPGFGAGIFFARWDGRIKQKLDLVSRGDPSRVKEIVYSLQGDPFSVASLIPFEDAYRAVKEFMETGGELPTCIEWGRGALVPKEAFAPHLYRS